VGAADRTHRFSAGPAPCTGAARPPAAPTSTGGAWFSYRRTVDTLGGVVGVPAATGCSLRSVAVVGGVEPVAGVDVGGAVPPQVGPPLISSLKRGYGWDCTRLDGTEGTRIWTGQGVFAHNLVKIGALAS